jgi:hypothetical protein
MGGRVLQVRSGVRAIPKRTAEGSPPLLGRLPQLRSPRSTPSRCSWWLFTGLGVRGLLYHGLMAEKLSAAIIAVDERLLDDTLRRWQH